jgi:flagellar hook-associated protein 1
MSRIALTSGLKALIGAQFALNTVGQNIANANTPGYSRQRVDLGAARPLLHRGHLLGNGVDVRGVTRTIDHLLERRILDQVQVGGSLTAQLGASQEIEGLFGEPGGLGLGGALDGFFGKLNQLSGNPADPILRTAAVQGGVDLASRFNHLERGLTNLQREVGKELGILTQQVNQLAFGIARLNGEISQAESAGTQPNDLRDQRQQLLKQLSNLVDVQTQEDASGSVRVLVSGNVIVNRETSRAMSVATDASGQPRVAIQGVGGFVSVRGGRIGGLLALRERFAPELLGRIDGIAKNLVLAVNRVHSQGIPSGGPFQSLLGTNAIKDVDLDGELRDELVANCGLPFPVTSGSFWVNVVDRNTGAVSKHSLSIDPAKTTVGKVIDDLNAIPNLTAGLDAFGRMQIIADAGFGFDFSNRVDPTPGSKGTFGSGQASLGGSATGPFAMVGGDTLEFAVPAGSANTITVSFAVGDFANPSKATAAELATALNADSAFQTAGLVAQTVDGRLFVQSAGSGQGESFSIEGGSAATKLGFGGKIGTAITGSFGSVAPIIDGVYKGAKTGQLVFVPTGDGTIGTTPGLGIDVLDANGQLVKTLLVGSDYQPGTALDLGDGLSVTFHLGTLSATDGDRMVLDVVADSDTSDILVALGLNGLFTGHDAASIGIRKDVELDPGLLAASTSGAEGDNAILLALLGVEEQRLGTLGNATLGEAYGALIGDVGFQVAALADGAEASRRVQDSLELRRESISGVNVDEELVDMVRFEQAFAGASQLIRVLNQLHDELLRIL